MCYAVVYVGLCGVLLSCAVFVCIVHCFAVLCCDVLCFIVMCCDVLCCDLL